MSDTVCTNDGLNLIIPMKATGCSKEDLESIISSELWTCDFKLDGHFFMVYVNFPGSSIRFFSRNISTETNCFSERTENLGSLIDYIGNRFSSYGQMIIAGELVHFLGKDMVTSVVNGHLASTSKKQEKFGSPVICLFDILTLGTWIGNKPLSHRRKILEDICSSAKIESLTNSSQLTDSKLCRIIPTLENMGEGFTKKDMWKYAIDNGFEGLVHKKLDSLYVPGHISNNKVRIKSSKDWIKQKKKREFDVVVTRFTNAKPGQFSGLVGAIVFGQYKDGKLIEIGQASGFDVSTRQDMTAHPEKYIGKVAVIEAQERSSSNKLRHSQYKGLREDKSPEECVYNEYET